MFHHSIGVVIMFVYVSSIARSDLISFAAEFIMSKG